MSIERKPVPRYASPTGALIDDETGCKVSKSSCRIQIPYGELAPLRRSKNHHTKVFGIRLGSDVWESDMAQEKARVQEAMEKKQQAVQAKSRKRKRDEEEQDEQQEHTEQQELEAIQRRLESRWYNLESKMLEKERSDRAHAESTGISETVKMLDWERFRQAQAEYAEMLKVAYYARTSGRGME
jgi:hypothetical protein